MAEIIWTAQSLGDVDNIANYISADSEFYAKQFVQKLFTATLKLEKYPEIGKHLQELADLNYREIIFKKYRIIYQLNQDIIHIITVHHSSRLLSNNESLKDLLR